MAKERLTRSSRYAAFVTSYSIRGDSGEPTGFALDLLASTLVKRGALHQPAANWPEKIVIDGRLITGRNPASARAVGEVAIKQLKAND
ncbi:hypothetical protein [Xanthomonas arboricola]|uniref:hypothetical protein n=1 Tax=Xanthomonas arboricola TaxID=56448 RepID=UPI0011AFE9BE|nr:hypothetical protein [Xanthomonas arboricola]NJB78500.1 putative intracellular protease/amidase [Xanthomonas arboricola]CAG2083893.1 hypothetical protein XCY_000502 [Xanthomonas arboricola pv. juglandis]